MNQVQDENVLTIYLYYCHCSEGT